MNESAQMIRVEETFPKFGGACERCKTEFEVGDWYCEDGKRHVVRPKTYRHTTVPQHIQHDENGYPREGEERTIVTCDFPRVLPQWWTASCYENYENMGGAAVFLNGRCETSDPQQQYTLDSRPDYNRTEEEWLAAWLSYEKLYAVDLERREAAIAQAERELESMRKRTSTKGE